MGDGPSPQGPNVWESESRLPDGQASVSLFTAEGGPCFFIPNTGTIQVSRENIRIWSLNRKAILPYILGRVLGLWLEMVGRLVLHGALVEMKGKGVGFLAQSGMGKSTLLTALVRGGCGYLSDDLISVRREESQWMTGQGLLQVRIWPDSGNHFFADYGSYAHVHPQYEKRKIPPQRVPGFRVGEMAVPLSQLVILQRLEPDQKVRVEWKRLPAGEAMVQLIAQSYNVEALEALGLQKRRMPQLAKMAEDIPVWLCSYPSGFDRLPELVNEMMQKWF